MLYYDRINVSKRVEINQKSVIFVTIAIFQITDSNLNNIHAIDIIIY